MALIQAFISSAEFYRAAAILRYKLVYVLRARSPNGCHISFPLINLRFCKRASLARPAAALPPHLRWAYPYGFCRLPGSPSAKDQRSPCGLTSLERLRRRTTIERAATL